MGLWLKCPKCQTANSLDLKSCMKCNASLENLPAAKRVYILADKAPAAPKAAAAKAAPKAAAPKAAAKKAPAPKKAAKAKAAKEDMDLEVISSTAPPSKRTRGPKALRKKA
jgi:acetyl-CoA carboxylase beta subunit